MKDINLFRFIKLFFAAGILILILTVLILRVPAILLSKQINNEKYNEAIKSANLYLKILPAYPTLYNFRAFAKFNLEDYEGAIEDYQKAIDYSNTPKAYTYKFNKVLTMAFLPDTEKTLQEFDKCIAEEESLHNKINFVREKAEYQWQQLKDYKGALETLNSISSDVEKNRIIGAKAVYYCERSKLKEILNDKEGAQKDYDLGGDYCTDGHYWPFTGSVDKTFLDKVVLPKPMPMSPY